MKHFVRLSGLLFCLALTDPASAHTDRYSQFIQALMPKQLSDFFGNSASNFGFGKFSQKVATQNFIVYGDLPRTELEHYARFAELFIDYLNREFFKVTLPTKINVVILSNQAAYQRYLHEQNLTDTPPEAGLYDEKNNLFVSYQQAGLRVFAYEIMHIIADTELPNRPAWAMDGVPAFFATFYAYEKNAKLELKLGFQDPEQLSKLGEQLQNLTISDIFNADASSAEKRLLTTFIYQQGLLKKFFELIQQNQTYQYQSYLEAAFDKPLHKIAPDWQHYLQSLNPAPKPINHHPIGTFFHSEAAFNHFAKQHYWLFTN